MECLEGCAQAMHQSGGLREGLDLARLPPFQKLPRRRQSRSPRWCNPVLWRGRERGWGNDQTDTIQHTVIAETRARSVLSHIPLSSHTRTNLSLFFSRSLSFSCSFSLSLSLSLSCSLPLSLSHTFTLSFSCSFSPSDSLTHTLSLSSLTHLRCPRRTDAQPQAAGTTPYTKPSPSVNNEQPMERCLT